MVRGRIVLYTGPKLYPNGPVLLKMVRELSRARRLDGAQLSSSAATARCLVPLLACWTYASGVPLTFLLNSSSDSDGDEDIRPWRIGYDQSTSYARVSGTSSLADGTTQTERSDVEKLRASGLRPELLVHQCSYWNEPEGRAHASLVLSCLLPSSGVCGVCKMVTAMFKYVGPPGPF